MKYSRLAGEWIKHRLNCKNEIKLHSSFHLELFNVVLNGKLPDDIKAIHSRIYKSLISDQSPIVHQDFGAGSRLKSPEKPTIATIAKKSLKSFKEASLMVRIADFIDAQNFVELGTSFGLTTYLMAVSLPDIEIVTIEGSPEIADRASILFNSLPENRINLIAGTFEDHFENALQKLQKIDFLLIDGNHRYQPTVEYFQTALKYTHPNSVIVFDDIRWSDEMSNAWGFIVNHKSTTLTLDFFNFGIAFFNPDLEKQKLNICL